MTINDLKQEKIKPVIIANHQGIIIYINKAFEDEFLWDAEELKGQLITAIIPSELQNAHHMGFSKFIATDKPTILNTALDLKITKGDGSSIMAKHYIIADKNGSEWIFGATIESDYERK